MTIYKWKIVVSSACTRHHTARVKLNITRLTLCWLNRKTMQSTKLTLLASIWLALRSTLKQNLTNRCQEQELFLEEMLLTYGYSREHSKLRSLLALVGTGGFQIVYSRLKFYHQPTKGILLKWILCSIWHLSIFINEPYTVYLLKLSTLHYLL